MKPRKVKTTANGDHRRRVHVYGWTYDGGIPRGWSGGISVQTPASGTGRKLRPGDALIAWLPRRELRKVRDALNRLLGDK